MDVFVLNVKSTHTTPFLIRNWVPCKSISPNFVKILEIRGLRRNGCGSHSLAVTVMAKNSNNRDNSTNPSSSSGNGDQANPEGDGTEANNSSSEKHKSHLKADWREFRAALFAREQTENVTPGTHDEGRAQLESKPLGLKWAHKLSSPETGCVLVATEKLDGFLTFERTVVLILRSGTFHPQEGPFGVVINRPLNKKIKHMNPSNLNLATTLADCPLHFGGPLEASMFLLRTRGESLGFEEVVLGISFGARNSLGEAAGFVKKGVVKAQDFKFFMGYAGWQMDQLIEEIESGYWHVAACSADLIFGESENSSDGLWEEILQLMGGRYSELSRMPKQDLSSDT